MPSVLNMTDVTIRRASPTGAPHDDDSVARDDAGRGRTVGMDDARAREDVDAPTTEAETTVATDDATTTMKIFQKVQEDDDAARGVVDASDDATNGANGDDDGRDIARPDDARADVAEETRRPDLAEEVRRPAASRGTRRASASTTWRRPALANCSLEDFMYDFMTFHEMRGRDWEKAWAALDRVFSRTGSPFDPLHFYRQVCAVGGFVSRESAKERVRGTFVFQNMHNYYENHTMTDCGNRLLTAYELYFWEYERAHPEDVTRGACRSCGGGVYSCIVDKRDVGIMHKCFHCQFMYHERCQPPERFDVFINKGKNAGCTSTFLCWGCARMYAMMGAHGVRAIEKYSQSEREDLDTYYERLYGMLARRGRAYSASYVKPTQKEKEPVPPPTTTADVKTEAPTVADETVEAKMEIETGAETPMET